MTASRVPQRDLIGRRRPALDRGNWRIFGCGGRVQHPESLRTELVYRSPWLDRHEHSKWICRTSRIASAAAIDIHRLRWVDSRRVVSENELLCVNHCVTQSLHYFTEVKMKRGDAANIASDRVRDMRYFERYDKDAVVLDRMLADLVSGVQAPLVWNPTAM